MVRQNIGCLYPSAICRQYHNGGKSFAVGLSDEVFMSKLKLIIGNKNYSSWSLRPWILLKYFNIPFDEVLIPLYAADSKKKIVKYSPSGKVPALLHGKVTIWDSLAICEYLAELYPQKKLWPQLRGDRALARALCQEMHAGFAALRSQMGMNIRRTYPRKKSTPEVVMDIARISAIWTDCRRRFKNKGPFLFGTFTIVDAVFLPVATRFRTYGVSTGKLVTEYMTTLLKLPAFLEWEKAAIKEPWVIEAFEIY